MKTKIDSAEEKGGTGNLPVTRGNLPHGMTEALRTLQRKRHRRLPLNSVRPVARRHVLVARATRFNFGSHLTRAKFKYFEAAVLCAVAIGISSVANRTAAAADATPT